MAEFNDSPRLSRAGGLPGRSGRSPVRRRPQSGRMFCAIDQARRAGREVDQPFRLSDSKTIISTVSLAVFDSSSSSSSRLDRCVELSAESQLLDLAHTRNARKTKLRVPITTCYKQLVVVITIIASLCTRLVQQQQQQLNQQLQLVSTGHL